MRQFNFVKDAILEIDGQFITDHNRTPLSVSYERIESSTRTQNGTLRKYHRADKRTVSCNWDNLPPTDNDTVDGGAGAKDIETIYKEGTGVVDVVITYDTGVTENLTMVITSFSLDVESRKSGGTLYSASLELEEV